MTGPSILIVDDEAFMRRVVRQALVSLGCNEVVDVSSATEALALLGKSHFDLILSDIYMPNMSGLDLLKLIRTGKAHVARDSRLIFLTCFSNTELLNTSMMLDVNGFMVKPITSEMVKKFMQRALKETMYLRSEADYESVPVHDSWASHVSPDEKYAIAVGSRLPKAAPETLAETVVKGVGAPEPKEPQPGAEPGPGEVLVSILQIPVGAVLAERLVAKDGTLLLSSGQKLTPQLINRINELHSILVSDMVMIEAQEVEGSEQEPTPPLSIS